MKEPTTPLTQIEIYINDLLCKLESRDSQIARLTAKLKEAELGRCPNDGVAYDEGSPFCLIVDELRKKLAIAEEALEEIKELTDDAPIGPMGRWDRRFNSIATEALKGGR